MRSPKCQMRGLTATTIIGFDIDGAKVQWMRGVLSIPLSDSDPRNGGILPACPRAPHDFGRAIQIARKPAPSPAAQAGYI